MRSRDLRVGFRVEVLEGEILQFTADLAHSKTMRDRRVDLQGLARDTLAALGAQTAKRPHVVQPVRQLHNNHTDVIDHRQEHLAVALGLAIFGRKEIDLTEFGDAVDAARHLIAKVLLNVGGGDAGVFHDVVEETGLNADHVHAHIGQDLRHRERVAHVRLTGGAHLPRVILRGEPVRFLDGRQVVFRTHFPERGKKLFERVRLGVVGRG